MDDLVKSLYQRVSNIVNSSLSIEEILQSVVSLTVQVSACDACLVYLLDSQTQELVLSASQLPHEGMTGSLRLALGEGITGAVAQQKAPIALPFRAAADGRFKRVTGLVEDTYEAMLSVPMLNGGELIGVVNVHHREPRRHSAEEVNLLTFVAEQMGAATARWMLAEMNTQLARQTSEIQRELQDRKLIERAKGILQRQRNLSEEEAYVRMRNQSRRLRRPMREVAEAIIVAEQVGRLPEAVSPD